MIETIRKLAFPIALLLGFTFLIFLANQISGIYLLASGLNPLFGQIVLGLLIILFAGLILSPLVLVLRLPKPLKRPETEEELHQYKLVLLKRMQKNAILKEKGVILTTLEDLPNAIAILDEESDRVIKSTASTVFLTTAISQNGKLDALTVFLTQVRMVWKIAHIYYQRPSLREMAYLYGNVGATSFLATQIEDVDLAKHLEPVITSIAKNASGRSVPIIGPTATLILDSLLEGTTNAFLSLRVGILSKKYCAQLTLTTKKEIKTSTLKEASTLLRKIAVSSSGAIITSIVKGTQKAGVDTLKSGWDGVVRTGGKVKDAVVDVGKKVSPFRKKVEKEEPEPSGQPVEE
ncbi:MAG: DUF697 domain-containing protein [Bacteroidota bacterium]